jgi:hypothetical protein
MNVEALEKLLSTKVLNRRVTSCKLGIWPGDGRPIETDIKLCLGFDDTDLPGTEYIIGIPVEGDSVTVSVGPRRTCCPFNTLAQRMSEWAGPAFWEESERIDYEYFDVGNSEEFHGVVGSVIVEIAILATQGGLPLGIRLVSECGRKIFVVPGMTMGTVRTDLPDDWLGVPYQELILSG